MDTYTPAAQRPALLALERAIARMIAEVRTIELPSH